MSLSAEKVSASSQTSKSRANRIKAALILGSLSAFGPLSLDMYLPALPKMADDLNTSAPMVQLSLTACLLGLALGQLIVGPLSDTRGRRAPLIVSMAAYAISSLLCVFAPNAAILNVLRFIQGLSGSAGIVLSRAVVRDMYSGSELTKFFSLLMLINGAAPILAPILGGQLLAFTSWRGVFVVLTVIGVLMLLSVLLGLPETLPKDRRQSGGLRETLSTFSRLTRDRLFIGYCLCQGLISAAMFGYISGSSFVLQNRFQVSEQTFSLIFALNGLGIIFASQITGRLAGRINESSLLRFGIGLAALASLVLLGGILLDGGLAAVLIPLFFVVSCVGIVGTASFTLAMQNQQDSAGSASALLGLLPYILGAAVAPLVGLGGDQTALPMALVIAIADVGAVLSYIFLVRPVSRRG
ncbi:DHA1 family bicyclomycin/chloramphenicol resistance-like MFS transporter [Fontibacillus phaseoli]|uniref:Bcr/CflA family efflux transporter n=1 Tax=Fontibacillus phaseoli TaxID=1416533 RepID=A0A369BBH5_9BACL|nr:multidrug effflux MFS transporter [Fontibacillus phaseoli]RCX17014.1 DHA1 family bicyclomycin/chloramphenicol resistance-like MFS transporter [Fontibacillus phaseoli]